MRLLFLQFWRLQVHNQVPADSVLSENSLPGLQMASHLLPVSSHGRETESWCLSHFWHHWAHHGDFTLLTSSKPHHLPMTPNPNIITLEVRASAYEWGGQGTHIQSTAAITGWNCLIRAWVYTSLESSLLPIVLDLVLFTYLHNLSISSSF